MSQSRRQPLHHYPIHPHRYAGGLVLPTRQLQWQRERELFSAAHVGAGCELQQPGLGVGGKFQAGHERAKGLCADAAASGEVSAETMSQER